MFFWRVMTRILVLLVACASIASPAIAQQAEPTTSPTNDFVELIRAAGARLETDENFHRVNGAADLPVPGQQGARIFADFMEINRKTYEMVARGNVTFATPEGRISADRIEFNLDKGTGVFYMAAGFMAVEGADRVEFGNQDPHVHFYGEKIEKLGPKHYVGTNGGFTTCVQPTPRWELGSGQFTLHLDDYALLRNTVLRVKGVPLMYLPVMYYPLHEDQRSTGFLMPKYGSSTLQGAALSNGFFWAIGRSQDATFLHDWFTRAGTGAGAEYRYLSSPTSGGQVRFYRLDQKAAVFDENGFTTTLPAQTSYLMNASLNQDLGRRLRAQGTVEYFSDVTTQQLYQQNSYQRSMSRRLISGGVTGNFGPATLGAYYSRSEQFSDSVNSTVYGSTPRITGNVAPSRLFGTPIYASLNTEYIFQPNRRLQDGVETSDESLARMDIAPALRVPLSRLSYLSVTTNAAWRQTYFSRSVDASGALIAEPVNRQYVSVQTDVIGPVFSKIWDTPDSGYAERMKHVIEPTFNVEYISEIANQARMPISDSSVVAVGGATNVTYGLTNRLLARTRGSGDARGSTREFLTVGVQQTYYGNPQTSLFDTRYVSYTGRLTPVDLSPVAVTARVSPMPFIDANARLEYDVAGGNGLQILTAGSTLTTGASSASLSFSRQRFTPDSPVSSYLTGASSWRSRDGRLTAFYGLNWDIDDRYIYSQSLGGAYMAQCCGVRADFQVVNFLPSVSSPIPSDRRLNFSFVLAGLGTFSNFFGLFGQP
jgi:LPS-assembly protein